MNYIKINKKNRTPLYLQIYQSILEAIESNELRDKDPLAYEEDVANYYRISRQVVRQAYNELEKEGLLIRIRRKGTFVQLKQSYSVSYDDLINLDTYLNKQGITAHHEVLLVESIFVKNSRFPYCFTEDFNYAYRIVYTTYANTQAIALSELYVPGHFNLSNNLLNQPYKIQGVIESNQMPISDIVIGLHPKKTSSIESLTLGVKENSITSEYSLNFIGENNKSYLFQRILVDGDCFFLKNEGQFQ